ncbi:MAG: retaining beta-glycosidase [Akkermansiaceae bacterium]|nr:retaining beta-glycosidase [Akkermansiaceae bacterium]
MDRMRLICVLALAATAYGEDFVPSLASDARLHLRVADSAPPLKDVSIVAGQVFQANWEPTPERRERLTDITFPIHWWKWQEASVRFTPQADGQLELILNGTWAEERPGVLREQEVLWDDLTAEGTTITNGGFEEKEGSLPKNWESPWRPYPAATDWPITGGEPLSGTGFAVSWHGRPLIQKITVKAGQPVTLKLHARAVTIPGFVPPKRFGNDTPAHQAAAKMKRGVNLGNGWEAAPGTWGLEYTVEDIDRIAAEGFDHIRVPVAWQYHLENGAIKPALLAALEPVLHHALEKNLRVILNWQHLDPLYKDPAATKAEFFAGWEAVATHFKDWPDTLCFELINEPNASLDGAVMNDIYRDAIATIRKTNPNRIILADAPQWSSIGSLDRLTLPDGDDRIIVSVHNYDPFFFTHQGASWVQLDSLKGVTYPGPPPAPVAVPDALKDRADVVAWLDRYNRLPAAENPCSAAVINRWLDDAAAWQAYFGRPVHLGEFGADRFGDPQSRERYVRDVRSAAEARHIPWTLWDWKAGFAYWDSASNKPLLKEAIFGK